MPKQFNGSTAKVIKVITVLTLVFITACILFDLNRRASDYGSGEEIAQHLLSEAANKGFASLTQFGTRACVYPPGVGLARGAAARLFPDHPIIFEERDDSEGYWYLIILEQRGVSIYAVDQRRIRWNVKEGAIYRDLIKCPSGVRIDGSQQLPELSEFIE